MVGRCLSFTSLQPFHRWREMEYSLPYQHTRMKWNILCQINTQGCHGYLQSCHRSQMWISEPHGQEADEPSSAVAALHSRNLRMSQSFTCGQSQVISQWTKQRHFSLRIRQREGQGSLRQANMARKQGLKSQKHPVWSQNEPFLVTVSVISVYSWNPSAY